MPSESQTLSGKSTTSVQVSRICNPLICCGHLRKPLIRTSVLQPSFPGYVTHHSAEKVFQSASKNIGQHCVLYHISSQSQFFVGKYNVMISVQVSRICNPSIRCGRLRKPLIRTCVLKPMFSGCGTHHSAADVCQNASKHI